MSVVPDTYPYYRFEGTHYEIGRQFGEACIDRIHQHLETAATRLEERQGIRREDALRNAHRFQPYVQEVAPFFDEEIRGIAAGAHISIEEAWLLQLRAELGIVPAEQLQDEPGDECTSFAILAPATSDGVTMIGQNADLPPFYSQLGVVVEMVFDDMPSVLMLTPAGQVSYLGINEKGMGAFANYLTCDGWRVGFPRYLFSRLALTHETVDDAVSAIDGLYRASSRNLMVMDRHGAAADLETTPARTGRIDPVDDIVVHANHFEHPGMLSEERADPAYLPNTRTRSATLRRLLDERHGELNPELMQAVLRDRSAFPNCLCREETDVPEHDTMTFASLIARPTRGEMWVAVGPPNEHAYERYAFSTIAAGA
jgi:isopenicillin-N N-acyltransferase like protein